MSNERGSGVVVLDLSAMYDGLDMGGWEYVVRTLRDKASKAVITREDIADQIEAQTKPPRIPEPGLWGVVEAACKCDHERVAWAAYSGKWMDRGGDSHQWDELVDPTLIREGVN